MRIIHPSPADGRQHAFGVEFIDGVARVDSLHPERELALLQHGYRIEADTEIAAPFHADLGEPIIDLNSLTVPKLLKLAHEQSIDVPAKSRKPEIVELLSRQPAQPIPGSVDNGDGSFTAAGTPFAELTDEQLRDAAALEGLDVAPDAERSEIIGAFIRAGMDSD